MLSRRDADHDDADQRRREFELFHATDGARLERRVHSIAESWGLSSDDLNQEVLPRLIVNFDRLSSPFSWALTVAQNLATRWAREPFRQITPLDAIDEAAHPADLDPADTAVPTLRMRELVAELPPRQREVLTLSINGADEQQIAQLLGISRKAARSALQHARSRLRGRVPESVEAGANVVDGAFGGEAGR